MAALVLVCLTGAFAGAPLPKPCWHSRAVQMDLFCLHGVFAKEENPCGADSCGLMTGIPSRKASLLILNHAKPHNLERNIAALLGKY